MCVFPKDDLNETWIKARNRQGDWLRRSSLQFIDYTILLIYSVVEEGEMVNLESMQTPFFTIKKPAKYKWANCTWKPSKNQGNTQMHFLRLREESNFKLSTVSRHIIFIHFTYTMIYGLTVLGLSWFHINFTIICSNSVKNVMDNLIGIVLNS